MPQIKIRYGSVNHYEVDAGKGWVDITRFETKCPGCYGNTDSLYRTATNVFTVRCGAISDDEYMVVGVSRDRHVTVSCGGKMAVLCEGVKVPTMSRAYERIVHDFYAVKFAALCGGEE